MEPEIIDWDSIESVFIEDDTYENLNAPKWVDFCASIEQPVNDDAWFCNPGCKHPKTVEGYLKSKRTLKEKFLKAVTISDMFSFKDRTSRDAKMEKAEIPNPRTLRGKGPKFAHFVSEGGENMNPNFYTEVCGTLDSSVVSRKEDIKSKEDKKQQVDDLHENSTEPKLFSSRNLLGRKEVLNQITEFCSELKKRSKEKVSGGVLAVMKSKEIEKERMPLLEVREGESAAVINRGTDRGGREIFGFD